MAYGIFLANLLFGVAVGTGIVPRGRFRRLHHLLYFGAMASIIAALVAAIMRGDGSWPRLAAMTVILAAMPRFRGGERAHTYYALFALAVYTLVVATS